MPTHTSPIENLLLFYARNFPIRHGKMRLVDSLWRFAFGNGTTMRLAVLRYGGFKMECDVSEMLQRQYYFFGTYLMEQEIIACWQSAARGANVILDVGANAGIYSLAALAVEGRATVHAFEPTPEIAARLQETARLNRFDNLHVHEAAVFSKCGEATLRRFRGECGANEGMNFITSDVAAPDTERVQTVCLDEFCQEHAINHVDLLKLDIQGHEHSALVGAQHMIRGGRIGTIFMELNWAHDNESFCTATQSVRLLAQAGYRFSKPGSRLHWSEAGDWLRGLTNVAARNVDRMTFLVK